MEILAGFLICTYIFMRYLLTFSSCDKLISLISSVPYWLETHSHIFVQLVYQRVRKSVLQFTWLQVVL